LSRDVCAEPTGKPAKTQARTAAVLVSKQTRNSLVCVIAGNALGTWTIQSMSSKSGSAEAATDSSMGAVILQSFQE
jgi:hypothetical protein